MLASHHRNPRGRRGALHRFQLLAALSRDIVLLVRRDDGRILEANDAALAAYGYQREEILHLTIADLRAAEARFDMEEQLRDAYARGILYETLHRRADGTTFPVEVSARGADLDGERLLVSVVRDITDRKRAQAREEALARFPRENPDPVMRLDGDLILLYANAPALALVRAMGGDPGAPAPAPLAEAARQALRRGGAVRAEVTGPDTVFFFSVVPVAGEVNLYGHDITARKAAEEALGEADRNKTEFLALLSHELRNPLATIGNSVQLLDSAQPGSDAARRALATLRRQAGHLTRLVDDLLDVARISRGKVELRLDRLEAREQVRQACDDQRARFEERGVALTFQGGAGPVWIEADAARLAQMVGNLLANALKFTPSGGRVEVGVDLAGRSCRITVRDSGMGIEPAVLPRIFDPFVQGDRSARGASGGLGLGLALVRDLARLHGGTATGESEGPGRGACFTILLPAAEGPPAQRAMPGPPPQRARGLRVLIVEDNDDAGTTLADLLVAAGHQALRVATGTAGVEAAAARTPDVLICDVGLPDMSGYDVVRAIRAASAAPPFAIALTGYAQAADQRRALEAGFDAHLAKPMAFDRLRELLEEAARRAS